MHTADHSPGNPGPGGSRGRVRPDRARSPGWPSLTCDRSPTAWPGPG
jgi:hypothetical protein